MGKESRCVQISRTYKKSSKVVGEDHEEEFIEVKVPPEGVPVGNVSVREGFTKGLAGYSSVSFAVSVSFPCVKEEAEDAYNYAEKFVAERCAKELQDVKKHYDDGRKGL